MKFKELIPFLQKENLYEKRLFIDRTRIYRITIGTFFPANGPQQDSAFFYDGFDMREIAGWSDPLGIPIDVDVQFASDYQALIGRHVLVIKHKNGKPYNLFKEFD